MNAQTATWQRVFIEITNRCDFDCLFCPSSLSERPKGDMPKDLAMGLLGQFAEMGFAGSLYFHVLGEPLLHPDVFVLTDRAADLGMRPVIFTNGGALSEDRVRKILSSRACELVISMQTISRESYERLRRTPLDWDTYLGRIQMALAVADESDSGCAFRVSIGIKKADPQHPEDLYFLEHESPAQLRASIVSIFSRVQGANLAHVLKRVEAQELPDMPEMKVSERVSLSVKQMGNWRRAMQREPATTGRCRFFGKECAVLADGSVTFCHVDYDGRTTSGNIKESSLDAIVSTPEFVEAADGFTRGESVPVGCRRCRGVKSA